MVGGILWAARAFQKNSLMNLITSVTIAPRPRHLIRLLNEQRDERHAGKAIGVYPSADGMVRTVYAEPDGSQYVIGAHGKVAGAWMLGA